MDSRHRQVISRVAYWLTLAGAVAPLCSIATAQALLGFCFLLVLVAREKLRFPPLKLPLALFFLGTLLSLALSGHVPAGWPQVRKFYIFFLVLLLIPTVLRRLEGVWTLVLGWAAVAACSAVLGFAQFGRTLAGAPRGGDLYHQLVGYRITGFMSLWMTFAGQLMIVLLMLLAVLMFAPERRKHWRPLAACAAVLALGLLLALTRGPWIGAAAGILYLVWHWNRKWLLALPVLAALGFFLAPAALRLRVTSIAEPHSYLDSNQHRVMVWRTGLEMIKAHPWFGLGPEQVGKQFDSYLPADFPRPLPWGWRGHLHNIYLQTAAERGIPVLLVLLWLVGKPLWDFRRAAARPSPGLWVLHGAIAAMIAVLVAGFFEHNLGDSEVLQMFLTVIAIGYVAAGEATEPQRKKSPATEG